MKKTDSKTVAAERRKAGITAPALPDGSVQPQQSKTPIHVVECDAWELVDFHERMADLIPEINHDTFNCIRFAGGDWTGTCKSWEDAKRLLQEGWSEGADRARQLADGMLPLLPPPESLRRRTRWAEDGGELDRDRLYSSGIETAFRTTRQHLQRSPRTVRIIGSWSISGAHSAEQIAWNGAAITALVDLLEAADYRVELSLGLPANQSKSISLPVVRIKVPQEPLNINTVAAVAGHAGIFRSYGFAAITSSPYKVWSSFGTPMQLKSAWKQAANAGVLEEADAYMEPSFDERGAYNRVSEVLKQLMPDDLELKDRLDKLTIERAKAAAEKRQRGY
jgi:hypothetical protein